MGAHRYFPNVDDLLAEAALHVAFPDPALLSNAPDDILERLLIVDAAVERMISDNEASLRIMMASAMKQSLQSAEVPLRQNRRLPLIEAALKPVKSELAPKAYQQLVRALSLAIGTEAMLVFNDVLQLTPKQAREARHWTIRALVKAAEQAS